MKRSSDRSVATRLRALLLTLGLVLVGVVGVASPASASGAPVQLVGSQWLGGDGVNVCDASTETTCGGETHVGGVSSNWWQCVELAQRLYTARGWHSGTFANVGVAHDIYDNAADSGFTRQANGSITSVVPGDMLVFSGGGGSGHVGIISTITDNGNGTKTLAVVNQNAYEVTSNVTWNTSAKTVSKYGYMDNSSPDTTFSVMGIVHDPDNTSTSTPLTTVNGAVAPMAGHWWAGDSGEDFAYVTKNSDNGFSLAIQQQTPTGLQWKGVVWTQPGSSGVQFANTLFIPVDANNDGLLDIYYATSTDWSQPGFTVGYMQNTGSGLTYGGTKQTFGSLSLKDVKFLAGKWSSSGGPAFAYVTKNSDNGFSVATFSSDTSGNLAWRGVKWTQPGSSGVQFANTTFTPIDMTGDGIDELLYSTSTNPSNLGFSMGEMSNDGSNPFIWAGTKWAPTTLALAKVRFIPGHWDGPGREALAYVSQRPDNGFDLAVHGITASGSFTWQGVWYSSAVVPYVTTVFVPADTSGDGYMDMLYATASQSGAGFNMAIAYNNTNNTGLTYGSQQWDQTGLTLSRTVFLPQF